jgi:Uma2 family endonuclease
MSRIGPFVEQHQLGLAGAELGCVLSRSPDVVRAPDVAFVSAARLTTLQEERFFEGAPDLAVEVLSPNDKASEIQEKIREYLAAGARLVWIVDPQSQTVTAYRPSGNARFYSGDQEVSGEDVLPGFSFRPSALFRLD